MYDNDKARVGHDATDFAAYGLSDPRGQYGNRDTLDSTYTDKIDAAFIADELQNAMLAKRRLLSLDTTPQMRCTTSHLL
jgi:hypothetical protein